MNVVRTSAPSPARLAHRAEKGTELDVNGENNYVLGINQGCVFDESIS